MTEADHTAEGLFGGSRTGRRTHGVIYAGLLQIDHDETINTGMGFVHALVACPVEDRATDTPFACAQAAATTGAVTMTVFTWDNGDSDAGSNHYVMAVGTMR